jgi:hypothetical protein
MSKKEPDLATLAGDLISHFEKLIDLQVGLLKSEVRAEVRKAGATALSLAAGAGLLAGGGVMSTFMLVHLLHRQTRLPLWTCYGIVAGALGAAGVSLLKRGSQTAAELAVPTLLQTTEGFKENVVWLKEQLTPGPTS